MSTMTLDTAMAKVKEDTARDPDGHRVCVRCRRANWLRYKARRVADGSWPRRDRVPVSACAKGHEFTEENTRRWVAKNGSHRRICRDCDRERSLAYYRRKAA